MNNPPPRLSDIQLQQALRGLNNWQSDGQQIQKECTFSNFSEAFGFMTRVAFLCETHNHHPDWSNTWNRVSIRLSTHESDGITERDIALATAIEQVLQSYD